MLVLAGQLNLNPLSRCRMIRLGGDIRWIGWDTQVEAIAAQYDLVAAMAGGKKFKEKDRYPRPDRRKPQLFAPSIAEFNVGAWMRAVNK